MIFLSVKIPVTKEEKAAAARKYGMIEEDYVPYGPDEHPSLHMGDYPNIKPVGGDERSGHYNWDFPQLKKDFGEPMHENWNFHQGTRSDTGRKWSTPEKAFLAFLCNYFFFFGFCYATDDIKIYFPSSAHQLPADGVTHYTFERADQE